MLGSESVTLYFEKNKIIKREISTEDHLNYKNKDLRINKELKIGKTAIIASTGELNIYDAFDDTRFNQEVDLLCGRLMRSVLTSTFPRENKSIGVIQVNNKLEGNCFVRIDTFMLKLIKRILSIWSYTEDVRATKNYIEVLNNDVFLPILTYQFDRGLNLIEDIGLGDIQISSSFFSFQEETNYSQCPGSLLNLMTYTFTSVCEVFNDSTRTLRNFLYMVRQCYWETPSEKFEYAFESFRLVNSVIRNYPSVYSKNEVCNFLFFPDLYSYNFSQKVAILISVLCLNINSRFFPDHFFTKTQSHLHEVQNYHPNRIQNFEVTEFLIEVSIFSYYTLDPNYIYRNLDC